MSNENINTVLSAIASFSTLAAVIVALFGERMRAWLFQPSLKLDLLKPQGEVHDTFMYRHNTDGSIQTDQNGTPIGRMTPGRYYHLRVTNSVRWKNANNVQVFLTQVQEPGPDGEFVTKWTGDTPMRWRSQEQNPVRVTIGRPYDCDLFQIIPEKWLKIQTLYRTFSLADTRRVADEPNPRLRLTLQARSDETDSKVVQVEVAWDGGWHDGDQEMQRHSKVRLLPTI